MSPLASFSTDETASPVVTYVECVPEALKHLIHKLTD